MPLVGEPLRGESRIAERRRPQQMAGEARRNRWRLALMLGHLDLGQRKVGAAIAGLEEIDVPMEAAVGPRVARLAERLASDRPQPLEIGFVDLGFDLDHLAVDRALEAEDVAQLAPGFASRLDRADAHAGAVEIGLAEAAPGDARRLRQPGLELAVLVEDELAFVFDRHAL